MGIDLTAETILALSEAPRHVPLSHTGRTVSFPTVWRWALRGIVAADGQRIRLETLKLGGRTVTSLEALQRFAERLSPRLDAEEAPPTRTPAQRRRASERAAEELREAGI
jgi:hypothetical protein